MTVLGLGGLLLGALDGLPPIPFGYEFAPEFTNFDEATRGLACP